MKLINLLFLLIIISTACLAQQSDSLDIAEEDSVVVRLPRFKISKDTLSFKSRSFDKAVIENFKADDDFRYGRPKVGITPWQRFVLWASAILFGLLHILTQTLLGQIIFYTVCFLLLLWVILKLLNIDARDLFYSKSGKNTLTITGAENIHEVDFEQELQKAAAEKKYREAVRLMFLFSLKKLSDAHLIEWVPGKTNDEYLYELRQHPTRTHVQNLRHYFEYAWYGHFELTEQTYQHVNSVFQEFKNKLS